MLKLLYGSGKDSDIFYKVRLDIPDPFFFVDLGSSAHIFLDHREYGVFEDHNKNPNIQPHLVNPLYEKAKKYKNFNNSAAALAYTILEELELIGKEVSVSCGFRLDMADVLRKQGVKITPLPALYPERETKSEGDIAATKTALSGTHHAFACIERILKESHIEGEYVYYRKERLTSELLKYEASKVFLSQGLVDIEGMIISCKSHAAIPHHRGGGPIFANETIICDLFPRDMKTGHFSDMTRTYVKGEASEYVQKMYSSVQKAQEAAIDAIRPGVVMEGVHQVCVDIFLQDGFDVGDAGFIHGTGHGLGIDIHESPYVKSGSKTVIKEGMVFTIEPGLYYPEHGGVRIEDVVCVRKDGAENLTQYPKQLCIV
jgi:Xaa-Pro aminopeptidase